MSGKVLDKKVLFRRYLEEKGLKSTSQRDHIVDTFFRTKTHINLQDLLKRVRRRNQKIGYATVYRTMKLLSGCGLAFERHFGDNGQTCYEHLSDDSHHDHLICIKCGKIAEFSNDRIERLQKSIADDNGFKVINHKMELYGFCKDCV